MHRFLTYSPIALTALLTFLATDYSASAVEIEQHQLEKGALNYMVEPTEMPKNTACSEIGLRKWECSCTTDIMYPSLNGDKNLTALNDLFRQEAEEKRCDKDTIATKTNYKVTMQTQDIVSLVFKHRESMREYVSECHAGVIARTINTTHAHVYKLDEVLDTSKEKEIQISIVSHYLADKSFLAKREKLKIPQLKVDVAIENTVSGPMRDENNNDTDTARLWGLGFFIENGQLFVELDSYLLDCDSGPSFPVPIPKTFVTNKEILSLLEK